MPEYKLINPLIDGSMKKTVSAPTEEDAATKIWDNLSSILQKIFQNLVSLLKNLGTTSYIIF